MSRSQRKKRQHKRGGHSVEDFSAFIDELHGLAKPKVRWNAIRFVAANKKLKRALRHKKKYFPNGVETPLTSADIEAFIGEMSVLGCVKLATIGRLALACDQYQKQYGDEHEDKLKLAHENMQLKLDHHKLREHVSRLEEKLRDQKRIHKERRTKMR